MFLPGSWNEKGKLGNNFPTGPPVFFKRMWKSKLTKGRGKQGPKWTRGKHKGNPTGFPGPTKPCPMVFWPIQPFFRPKASRFPGRQTGKNPLNRRFPEEAPARTKPTPGACQRVLT